MATFAILHTIEDTEVDGKAVAVPREFICNLDKIVVIRKKENFPAQFEGTIANAGIVMGDTFNAIGGNSTILVTETPDEIIELGNEGYSKDRSRDAMIEILSKNGVPVTIWVSDIINIQTQTGEKADCKCLVFMENGILPCDETSTEITYRARKALAMVSERNKK